MAEAETVVGQLAERASRWPDTPVLFEKKLGCWRVITIGELMARAAALAHGLREQGVREGNTVALLLKDRVEAIACEVAVMALGGCSLHLPLPLPASDISEILALRPPRLAVASSPEEAELVADPSVPAILLPQLAQPRPTQPLRAADHLPPDLPAVASIDLDDGIRIATLTHRALVAGVEASLGAFSYSASDWMVAARSLADPAQKTMTVYPALTCGARLALPESPGTLAAAIREVAPTVLHPTSRFLGEFATQILLRLIDTRGLKRFVARAWERRTGVSFETYGREANQGGFSRLLVGVPVRHQEGMGRLRSLLVSGQPHPPELSYFLASLGLPVTEVACDPAVAGPLAVQARPVVSVETAASGRVVVKGPQAALTEEGWGMTRIALGPGGWSDLARVDEAWQLGLNTLALERKLLGAPLFRSAVATGAPRQVRVQLEIDRHLASRWASQRGLQATTYRSLSALPELLDYASTLTRGVASEMGVEVESVTIPPRSLSEVPGALTSGGFPRRR
ncbi:MAG: long-chain-fatty-acid--CoA ligase [Acidimicrobiia bacterium]|nr:MAG: long-chain-fatty-acid--CoA ligase [Acidimicrobiia bacterium]